MTILSVAYPLLPVGPDSGGGAEQILYLLERGLVQRGHRSIVIAAEGSRVSGDLIETPAFHGEMTEEVRARAQSDHLCAIQQALERYRIDILHYHGLDFFKYLPVNRISKLATLHLPCAWYPESVFDLKDVQLVCVSEAQARSAPRRFPVIPNGIDTSVYNGSERPRKHLLWLGRICPEKGVHIALKVAHRLDLPIIVAGPVHPFRDHEVYFEEKVQPLLDEKRQYAGSVGLTQKRRILSEAICLLIPSLVEETSSLVAMEAISSGTPVIAYRAGALPEIIEHGVTGFVVDSQDEMTEALQYIHDLSPAPCRELARSRFDAKRMVDGYINLYESL